MSALKTFLAAGVLVILLPSCASMPPPTELAAGADAALASAVAANAEEHAPIELRFAREKRAGARLAMEAGNHARATRLLEQSIVNSELAVAKTAAAQAREAVRRQETINADVRADLDQEGGA